MAEHSTSYGYTNPAITKCYECVTLHEANILQESENFLSYVSEVSRFSIHIAALLQKKSDYLDCSPSRTSPILRWRLNE